MSPRTVRIALRVMNQPNSSDTAEFRVTSRQWLLIFAFWTFMGLLESSKAYVQSELRGGRNTMPMALLGNMPWWYFWALATPLIFWLARKLPLDKRRGLAWLPVYILIGIVLTVVHNLAVGWLYFHTHPPPPNVPFLRMITNWLEGYGMLNFLTYCAILGSYYILAYHSRYRASQLAAARLEVQAAQLQARVIESQLEALRMELNPHFLFNTLNAISGLVRRHENNAAVQTLARLGDLLRVTLERGAAQTVTLEKELELLRHYLDIEQVRFHDRLQVDIVVPEELLDHQVPSLILQPLVENAVRHGIAKKPGVGRIRIEASAQNGTLEVVVADTGVGFGPRAEHREGVGLSNTRARLMQMYGDRSSLTLEDNADGGATVRMRLPASNGDHHLVYIAKQADSVEQV